MLLNIIILCVPLLVLLLGAVGRVRDRMAVGFMTTFALSAYHH